MRTIDFLNKITFDGTIDYLFKAGVIKYNWLMYRDIYNMRDMLLKQGYSKKDSVYVCVVKFRIDYSNVYRALKKMEENIN
jgi:hypothetical protein